MADVRCPNCGKITPDFLGVCQFCQSPLKPEGPMHTGDKPTKKNTGELEGVLPDWLKDARQQARDLAKRMLLKRQPVLRSRRMSPSTFSRDSLFQSEKKDEDEVPDWLASSQFEG